MPAVPIPPLDVLAARLRAGGSVFAEDEAALLLQSAGGDADRLEQQVVRRLAGEPLEVVVGWAEFGGLRITVEPGVFVPRRRSELLVREAVSRSRPGAVVVDLGCGSGALGTAVAAAVPSIRLHAVDVEPAAVACARRNVPPGSVVLLGDLYAPLPRELRGRVDLLLANAPYVPSGELHLMPAEARLHEPRVTLDGGADGLVVQRRVIAEAPAWLAPGGALLVETSCVQAEGTAAAARAAGLAYTTVHDDDLDATVVVATRALDENA